MALQPAILGIPRLGNFQLGAVPADLVTARRTAVRVLLAGVDARVRVSGLSVRDILNETPNTCQLTFDGSEAPVDGQELRITIGSDPPRLLFAGSVQTLDQTYQGKPANDIWPCSGIDRTARLNRRRPFGTWTLISATTIAQALVATYAPTFTTTFIAAALPAVTITFDGSEDFSTALARLAKAIGGYSKVDDVDVYLFLTETSDPPDPIDVTHPPLNDPPITCSTDDSQLITRAYGKGHGEALLADVLAGDTILPVADAVMYGTVTAGGQVIASTTPDGAASEILTYTGVQRGGGGTLVGPGAAPTTAPALALAVGAGLGTGVYQYAYTDVTAAGETLPSPTYGILTGLLAAPASAPGATAIAGASVEYGVHQYAYTDVTAAGETLPSPVTSLSVGTLVAPPAPALVVSLSSTGGAPYPFAGPLTGSERVWAYTFVTAAGETLPSPTANGPAAGGGNYYAFFAIGTGPSGVIARKVYRTVSGGSQLKLVGTIADNTTTAFQDHIVDGSLGANVPTSNTAQLPGAATLTGITTGLSGVTQRKVYRTVAGGSQLKLLATIADNTTTTYTDNVADGSLGANAPTVGTAVANQVNLSGIAIGPATVTGRKIYRSVVNGTQLKLLWTYADNTSTTLLDSAADGSLGANAPTSDTSGLTQPSGQVNAGSTSLLTASAAPFAATGGWVLLAGDQVVRFTGRSGNALTGIPASGPGAILTTVLYGSPVLPAPALTGVTGVTKALLKGAPVHLWVQRDDGAAQAAAALRESTATFTSDGIHEVLVTDERRGEASLTALCDATLQRFSYPIPTYRGAVRDVKMRSGKTVHINLVGYPVGDYVVQDVTIDQIDVSPGTAPRYTFTAASVAFSLDAVLRQLLGGV